nr:MAG TPA: hypothetical protein [Caudoviricetes sp.]DAN61652.1 MAG TPA: hypothetical protein [Caudoviricetes sp.]
MQEPLYSLSWQATIRPGKRISLAPRFLQRPTRRVGRDPLFIWKRPRHLPQRLGRPFCRLPVMAWLENLKFRPSENAKTAQ